MWYFYSVNDGQKTSVSLSFVSLKDVDDVADLLKAIWEESKDEFKVHGIQVSEKLKLWLPGESKALGLRQKLMTVFGNAVEKEVHVTPSTARAWDATFAVRGTSEGALTSTVPTTGGGLDKLTNVLESSLKLTNITLSKLTTVLGMFLKFEMEEWKENTPSRTADGGSFKRSLVAAYGDPNDNHDLMCMVTGIRLPYKFVTAAHVLGKKVGVKARIMLKVDVDDPQNGVLWCSPVEKAWTNNKICFSWSVLENTYILLLLDDALQNTALAVYDDPSAIKAYIKGAEALGDLTFGQLHNKRMTFLNNFRPYKRSFLLMSCLKKQWAAEEGCKPLFSSETNFDYWSEGSYRDNVVAWLETQGAIDLKNPEAPDSEDDDVVSLETEGAVDL